MFFLFFFLFPIVCQFLFMWLSDCKQISCLTPQIKIFIWWHIGCRAILEVETQIKVSPHYLMSRLQNVIQILYDCNSHKTVVLVFAFKNRTESSTIKWKKWNFLNIYNVITLGGGFVWRLKAWDISRGRKRGGVVLLLP